MFMCGAGEADTNAPEAAIELARLLGISRDEVAIMADDSDHLLLPHGLVSGNKYIA